MIIDTSAILHTPMVNYWTKECILFNNTRKHGMKSRFQRAQANTKLNNARGDVLLSKIQQLFHHGFGITWSEIQKKIFAASIDALLPKIYGEEWDEVKQRVMHQRGIKVLQQETLVNMARRNGKTFVISGTAAAVFLVVPNLSVAVFSTGERAAKMLMTATLEKIDAAFDLGTHVNKQGYDIISKNKEMLVMKHPNGGKQVLGCYPGSVKVRKTTFLTFFL